MVRIISRIALAGSLLILMTLAAPVGKTLASASQQGGCPATSSNTYQQGGAYMYDKDNPVRPAWNHADKNLALRSYSSTVVSPLGFVVYAPGDPTQPPQFASIFAPDRVPSFTTAYRVNNWNWAPPPDPGTQGTPITTYPVTLLGLQTTPGETLQSPTHGRNLGSPWGAGGSMVIFADADSITLHFTRDDSGAVGYTVHIDGICTDPNLLSLYNTLDNYDRNHNAGNVWRDGVVDYNLPGLAKGQAFGVAAGTEIQVGIVDTGSFMDPRSRDEWWQIRPAINPPVLASPANGAGADNPVDFTWNTVSGAVSYKIMVDNNSDFSSPEVNTSVTATNFIKSGLAQGKKYYWKAKAVNSAGASSAWSAKWSVTINAPPPPSVPVLVSPASGSGVTNPVTFMWDPVSGAVKYKIRIDDNANFSSPVVNTTVTTTSFTKSGLTQGVTYYWEARAINSAGVASAWSAPWSITIQ